MTHRPVVMLGVPLDHNSSFLRGAAGGPGAIRAALHCGAANLVAETGIDLGDPGVLLDAGDVVIQGHAADHDAITAKVTEQLALGRRVLTLGGDHSITFPIIQAYAATQPAFQMIHFDAHPDLYDEFEGNRLSHASPFARIMEAGLVRGLTQIGIRTLNQHQKTQAERFNVRMIPMHQSESREIELPEGPVYVSVDLDALDPAFAPGVSHHEPGGLTVREVLAILQRIPGPVIGADIVELNPARDVNGVTAMVAAKLLKELAGRMACGDDPAAVQYL